MKDRDRGFTLIEVLVAMTIMIMIVLMLGAVFKQMTASWGVGMRKVKVTMESRAALDFMSQELAHAVADNLLIGNVGPASSISFFTFNSLSNRAVCKVTYNLSGEAIMRSWMPMKWECSGTYPTLETGSNNELLTGVSALQFRPSDNVLHTTNLPDWVDIIFEVQQNETVSLVSARSAGPDRDFGLSEDNISSER